MRIVLDSNILVRGNPLTLPQGLARELLTTITGGSHILLISSPLLLEVRRVLAYPHVQARWPLGEGLIDAYLSFLQAAGEMVEMPNKVVAVVRDPDDDPILQTAITGRADVLCTRDAAFQHPLVEEVCRQNGIRILGDVALMKELREGRGGEGL